jgi:N-acetylglucosamine kinase-like BadF-type ATPase
MKYYIGIDGGGTKTDCILTDENFIILNSVKGGSLNLLTKGPEESARTIFEILNTCLYSTKIQLSQIAGIGIGTAGAGRTEDASKLRKILTSMLPDEIKISVVSDAEAALEGAFNGKQGCILISGTGSIIYGKGSDGIISRCGGYGRILGDPGSGYSIGKKGLTAVIKQFDNAGKSTAITSLLNEKLPIKSLSDIITAIYKENFEIASIAPLVIKAAEINDPSAIEIIDEETDSLLELISCMIKKLKNNAIEIVFTGSLIATENSFSFILKEKISNVFKHLTIKQPEYPPAMGAVFIMDKERSRRI